MDEIKVDDIVVKIDGGRFHGHLFRVIEIRPSYPLRFHDTDLLHVVPLNIELSGPHPHDWCRRRFRKV